MTLTVDQLDQYKQALTTERARILSNIEALSDELGTSISDDTEENGLETHMGDVATTTFLRERNLSIGEHEAHLVQEIDGALERIRQGSFGLCVDCGNPISQDRLEALPWAARCIDDQNKQQDA